MRNKDELVTTILQQQQQIQLLQQQQAKLASLSTQLADNTVKYMVNASHWSKEATERFNSTNKIINQIHLMVAQGVVQ
jgi:hypothetical protein